MATLFEKFPPVTKQVWLDKIKKDLKGKPIEALDWKINEDLSISPFAHAEDLPEQYPPLGYSHNNNRWKIGVKIPVLDVKIANKNALNTLMNGANAIAFDCSKKLSKLELATLLKDIQLEWITTHFDFRESSWEQFLPLFTAYVKEQKLDTEKINCVFNIDKSDFENKATVSYFQSIFNAFPNAQFLINVQSFYQGTANIAKELAQILAKGNEFLVALKEHDLDLHQYHSKFQFSIVIDDSYFLSIAKIRALKLLWKQVLAAWKITQTDHNIIEVQLTEVTQIDNENYNKIKATAQAMAAVIGGVKRLYIYPSDAFKDGIGTPFAQRIALNIQHLMQLESYMDRVIDPAAGSYYIENLTNQLAEVAWKQFQTLVS